MEFRPYQAKDLPTGVRSRLIKNVNGIDRHILEAGFLKKDSQLILLLHGFPELAYSWRKILRPLADEGYHVVAPDQRGYGRSGGQEPHYLESPDSFKILNLVEDTISLIHKLGYRDVKLLVGHDFGASVAGWSAMTRPDICKAIALMSAPFTGAPSPNRTKQTIHKELLELNPPRKHYQWYYTTRNANQEIMKSSLGVNGFLRAYYHMKSADWDKNQPFKLHTWNASEIAKLPYYYVMENNKNMSETVTPEMPTGSEIRNCRWLTEAELKVYSDEFERTGFQGGLNSYWNNTDPAFMSELNAYKGKRIIVPSLFVAGEKDWGIYQMPGAIDKMANEICTEFHGVSLVRGAGHWVQQEKNEEVANMLKTFILQQI